jgi:hypothetical protein
MKWPCRAEKRATGNASIILTKADASLRHIEASIAAFDEGHYDVAITLAGAAEGMAPETGTALFPYLRDHPRIAAEGVGKTEWVSALNVERDWLKHHAPSHPATMEFERASAAIMLVRAISKAQAAFKFQSEATEEFRRWINENVETLFSDDDAQP